MNSNFEIRASDENTETRKKPSVFIESNSPSSPLALENEWLEFVAEPKRRTRIPQNGNLRYPEGCPEGRERKGRKREKGWEKDEEGERAGRGKKGGSGGGRDRMTYPETNGGVAVKEGTLFIFH